MSRRLTWWLMILTLCAFWFGAIFLGGKAAAAPTLADPNPYLERHGLHAPVVPLHVLGITETASTPLGALNAGPDFWWANATGTAIPVEACVMDGTPPSEVCPEGGRHEQPGLWVSGSMPPLDRARVTLHEWLHIASFWTTWEMRDCSVEVAYCEKGFVRMHEEGLVEALTLHLLPGWWRSLVGKPLKRWRVREERADPFYEEAYPWLAAAQQATGTPRWSRANRELLSAWLRGSLEQRVAALVAAR